MSPVGFPSLKVIAVHQFLHRRHGQTQHLGCGCRGHERCTFGFMGDLVVVRVLLFVGGQMVRRSEMLILLSPRCECFALHNPMAFLVVSIQLFHLLSFHLFLIDKFSINFQESIYF